MKKLFENDNFKIISDPNNTKYCGLLNKNTNTLMKFKNRKKFVQIIKNFLKYTISLPLATMSGLLFMIIMSIGSVFCSAFLYVITGFDAEVLEDVIQLPNECKDVWIDLIKDLID